MRQVSSLRHTRWECKYHIVFIPKYRRKRLYGVIRRELIEVFPLCVNITPNST
ncbi:transposase [Wenzhouxiangella sp. AB-CW3]|nr:transposase [Wenzhouxiangella sp. AB-CW3]